MSNQEQQQEPQRVFESDFDYEFRMKFPHLFQEEEEEEREYTIEKQVVGMGYMSFYDEEDMRNQIVSCSNGCWKLKGDKTARDLDGDLCITDDEEEVCETCGKDYDECETCECPNDAKCLVLCERDKEE